MPYRVHPGVNGVKAAHDDSGLPATSPQSQFLKLPLSNNPVLPLRQLRNRIIESPRLPFARHAQAKGNLGGGFSPQDSALVEARGRLWTRRSLHRGFGGGGLGLAGGGAFKGVGQGSQVGAG